MFPPLSIVIPCHNRADLLRLCLASIRRHASRALQLLVVDDGSEASQVSHLAEQFGAEAVRLPTRQGFCRAANAGLRAASGEIVQLLNDDTEVESGWIEAVLPHFAQEKVAAVTPLVVQYPGGAAARIDSAGDTFHPLGFARKRAHGKPSSSQPLTGGPVFGASGSSSFFRRSTFLEVGGLPEEFGAYFDDVDLSFRLRHAGYQVVFEPGSRVIHRVSSSHGPPRGDLLAIQSRNEEMVYWRNLRDWELLLTLPGHVAVLTAKAMLRAAEGQWQPWWAGRLAAWREMGQILHHRRRILPRRGTRPSIPKVTTPTADREDRHASTGRDHHGLEV
ncbi:MAG: glycosyltransferase family 2 protein [Gemmataceae bacterium]